MLVNILARLYIGRLIDEMMGRSGTGLPCLCILGSP